MMAQLEVPRWYAKAAFLYGLYDSQVIILVITFSNFECDAIAMQANMKWIWMKDDTRVNKNHYFDYKNNRLQDSSLYL